MVKIPKSGDRRAKAVCIRHMRKIPFTFEGKDYEIRVISDGSTTYIRAFLGNRPANGYTYQVAMPVAFDFHRTFNVSAVQHLIDTAKQDVIEKNWERVLEAIKQIEQYERDHPGSTESNAD
jgi:hypothetical protein